MQQGEVGEGKHKHEVGIRMNSPSHAQGYGAGAAAGQVAGDSLARIAAVLRVAAVDQVVLRRVRPKRAGRRHEHIGVIPCPAEAAAAALH